MRYMRYMRLFVRVSCAKIAFVAGLGIAPAIALDLHAPAPGIQIAPPG